MVSIAFIAVFLSMTALNAFRERRAIEYFFQRVEKKGVNPKEFIRPKMRIMIPLNHDDSEVRGAILGVLAFVLFIYFSWMGWMALDDWYNGGVSWAIYLIILIFPMIAVVGFYIEDLEKLKLAREERMNLINRFVFTIDISGNLKIINDENE